MQTYNIHEAKTHLSRLIEQAMQGEPFIIAKAGKPMVQVSSYSQPAVKTKRIGFMPLSQEIPKDFNQLGAEEIATLFAGEDE